MYVHNVIAISKSVASKKKRNTYINIKYKENIHISILHNTYTNSKY